MNISHMIAKVIEEANNKVVEMQRRAEILDALELEGVHIASKGSVVRYGSNARVEKSDLTKIRKVVGKLTMIGKDTAWDFDQTNELEVTLAPVNKENPITFAYRTKYRKGGKCKVVTHTSSPSEYKTLVCEK